MSLLHARVSGRRRCVAPACRESGGVAPFTLHSNATLPNALAREIIWMCDQMPAVVALDASAPEWKCFPEPRITPTDLGAKLGAHDPDHSAQDYMRRAPQSRNTEAWRAEFMQHDKEYTKYNPPWSCPPVDTATCKLLRALAHLTATAPKGGLESGSIPACGTNPHDLPKTALCLVSCKNSQVLESTQVHMDSCDARNVCLAQRAKGRRAAMADGGVMAVWLFAALPKAAEMRRRLLQHVSNGAAQVDTMVASASAQQLREVHTAWEAESGGSLKGVWLLEQCPGDIVEAPAGHQHAVANVAKCSKVAVEGGGLHSCAFAAAGRNFTRQVCARARAAGLVVAEECPVGAMPVLPTDDYCSVSNMLLTWLESAAPLIREKRGV